MSRHIIYLNTAYRHKRTGAVYIALHLGLAREDDRKWFNCVIYQRIEDEAVFARDVEHFQQNFELVEPTGADTGRPRSDVQDRTSASLASERIEQLEALLEKAREALIDMRAASPTDADMIAAGWGASKVGTAYAAYDTARTAFAEITAALGKEKPQ
jgi:hypothetical protein